MESVVATSGVAQGRHPGSWGRETEGSEKEIGGPFKWENTRHHGQ